MFLYEYITQQHKVHCQYLCEVSFNSETRSQKHTHSQVIEFGNITAAGSQWQCVTSDSQRDSSDAKAVLLPSR